MSSALARVPAGVVVQRQVRQLWLGDRLEVGGVLVDGRRGARAPVALKVCRSEPCCPRLRNARPRGEDPRSPAAWQPPPHALVPRLGVPTVSGGRGASRHPAVGVATVSTLAPDVGRGYENQSIAWSRARDR